MGDGLMFVFPSADRGGGQRDRHAAAPGASATAGPASSCWCGSASAWGRRPSRTATTSACPPSRRRGCATRPAAAQILTGQLVKMMTASRKDCFESVGTLDLKGIPDDYEAFEVTWQSEEPEASDIPLPALLRGRPAGRLRRPRRAARADEPDALRGPAGRAAAGAAVGRAGDRQDPPVHPHGAAEPRRGRRGAVRALHGGDGRPLRALDRGRFGTWSSTSPEDVLKAHVERHGGELTRLVPQLATRVEGRARAEDERPRHRALPALRGGAGAARGVLRRDAAGASSSTTSTGPTRQTLSLLRHVVSGGPSLPLLLIGTFRDSEVSSNSSLSEALAALRREQGVERVALKGLDRAGRDGPDGGRGGPRDGRARAARWPARSPSETDGNPFFVGRDAPAPDRVRHAGAAARTAAGSSRTAWTTLGLPQSVREVVAQRVERLGEQAVSVLGIAALIGREFDLDLLERVVRDTEEDVLDILESAVGGVDPGRVRGPGRALLLRPRADLAHPLRGHRRHPPRADASARRRGAGGDLRGGPRSRGWASWPTTGRRQP